MTSEMAKHAAVWREVESAYFNRAGPLPSGADGALMHALEQFAGTVAQAYEAAKGDEQDG